MNDSLFVTEAIVAPDILSGSGDGGLEEQESIEEVREPVA